MVNIMGHAMGVMVIACFMQWNPRFSPGYIFPIGNPIGYICNAGINREVNEARLPDTYMH